MPKNMIDAKHFEDIVRDSGLDFEPQKAFLKVKGPAGHAVYVALTKRVGRVDISGWIPELPGVRVLDEDEAFGNVKAQLDFALPEDEVLVAFEEVLAAMKELAPKAKPERKRPAKRSEDGATGWSTATLGDRAKRLELIRQVAAEKSVAVSPETLALAADEA